jgi:hypothetical protein
MRAKESESESALAELIGFITQGSKIGGRAGGWRRLAAEELSRAVATRNW